MKTYSIKVFLLHLGVALFYLLGTSYLFVVQSDPQPVGTGLRQALFIFLHVTITLFVMLTYLGKVPDKRNASIKLGLNIAAIILIIGTYSLFSNPIWEWLWELR